MKISFDWLENPLFLAAGWQPVYFDQPFYIEKYYEKKPDAFRR